MPLTLTRSLLVVLIPGLIALAPWLLWLVSDFKNPERYYKDFPELVWIALFTAATVAGAVMESINSWIEVYWDGHKDNAQYDVENNWHDYLARICATEPVGHGYLSRMVTTMYFELAMMWAVLSFGIGIIVLFDLSTRSCWAVIATIAAALVLAVWFYVSGRNSHAVLCKTRQAINQRLGSVRPAT